MKTIDAFLRGMSRLIAPAGFKTDRVVLRPRSDANAIRSYWKRTGDYMRIAQKHFMHNPLPPDDQAELEKEPA